MTGVEMLIKAIEDDGVVPLYHRTLMRKHKREWSTLWRWKPVAYTAGKSWDVPSRGRADKHAIGLKVRWECKCGPSKRIALDPVLTEPPLFGESA